MIKKKSSYIIIIIFLLSNVHSFSHDFTIEKITNEKGQELGYVYCSYKDNRGFLWFGTRNGLYRYDGRSTVKFKNSPFDSTTISDNIIVSISEDKYGFIWVITSNSTLNKLNPKTGKFIRYIINKEDLHKNFNKLEIPNSYYDIFIFKDSLANLWLLTNSVLKLYDYEQNKFIQFSSMNPKLDSLMNESLFYDYTISSDGILYLISEFLTTFYNKNKKFYLITINLKQNQYSIKEICSAALVKFNGKDSKNIYLISFGKENKQFVYNPLGNELREYKLRIDNQWYKKGFIIFPNIYFNHLFIKVFHPNANVNDSKKSYSGLYNVIDKNFRYSMAQQVAYYFFDKVDFGTNRGKIIWLGDDLLWERTNDGILKINLKRNYTTIYRNDNQNNKSLSNNIVRCVFVDRANSIYVGTDYGLNLFDTLQKNWKRIYSRSSSYRFNKNKINIIYQDYDGKMLVGTYKGLLYFDTIAKTLKDYLSINHKTYFDRQEVIWSLIRDKNRNLWIGTADGLYVYNQKNTLIKHYKSENSFLCDNKIWSLFQDSKDNIWIGTNNGLNRYIPDKDDFKVYLPNQNDQFSICGVMIWSIIEDNNKNLWFGAYGAGISKYNPEQDNFNSITLSERLPNETVVSMICDNLNNIWIGSSNGLIKYNQEKKVFSEYYSQDGFQGNDYSFHSAGKTSNGELIFGGSKGVTLFNPEDLLFNTKIPKIVVSQAFIKDSLVSLLKEDGDSLNLQWNFGYLTLHIASLDFTNPKLNKYAYKIEGINDDWIYLGNQNVITFSDIEPGNYILKLKASNNNDIWNNEGIKIYLNIIPPFWKTNWFKYLIFSIISLIIMFTLYYIIKRRRDKEETKRRIINLKLLAVQSQMNPHFIFNCLNSILNLILKRDNDRAMEYLTKFARLLRKVLENSREIMIPLRDVLEQLRIYLDLELLRFKNQFKYNIEIDGNLDFDEILFPSLLLQPYVENSIKHGKIYDVSDGYVNISIRKDNNCLYCQIVDNGIGRNKSKQIINLNDERFKSFGTELTEEIVNLLNSKVMITDLFDFESNSIGTKVEIILNINKKEI